jgi:hypothetical protein
MCKGTGCPFKDKCWRYLAPHNPMWQSFFSEVPFKKDKCEYYWEKK